MSISALNVRESQKFPHFIGNRCRGRGTWWWLCYGADTTFHRTYL